MKMKIWGLIFVTLSEEQQSEISDYIDRLNDNYQNITTSAVLEDFGVLLEAVKIEKTVSP